MPEPIETRVSALERLTDVLSERQTRMHEDLGRLTAALDSNTIELRTVNNFIANKRGFLGGIIAALSIASGAFGALIALTWDKITA